MSDVIDSEPRRWPRLRILIPHTLALILVLGLYLSDTLNFVEHELTDIRFGIDKRTPSEDLVVITIDPPSLQALNVWPWPRQYHAALVDQLVAAGAENIAFDIDFSSPSTPEADAAFEAALERSGDRVILGLFKQHYQTDAGPRLLVTEPLPRFQQHTRVASLSIQPASDGNVRRVRMRDVWDGRSIPSLWAELANRTDVFYDTFIVDFGFDYRAIPTLSFVDVLEGRFDPRSVQGKSVLIGATAIELQDIVPVPVYRSIPGVFLHAMSYNTLVADRDLQRLGPAPIIVVLLIIAFVFGSRCSKWTWLQCLSTLIVGSAGLFGASLLLHISFAVEIDVAPAILLMVMLFVWGLISRIDAQSLSLVLQNLRLKRADTFISKVTENSFDGIITMRADGTIETANASALELFEYELEALLDRHATELLPDLIDAEADGSIPIDRGLREINGRKKNGSIFPVEISVNAMDLDDTRSYIAILRDITKRQAYQAQLEYQAMHDDLTSLPNRAMLAKELEVSLEKAKANTEPMALLLLDLDRFKEVNDTLGHHVGDALLRNAAQRLTKLVEGPCTFARLGGDEFAILLPTPCDIEKARGVAETLSEALEHPFEFAGLSLEIGGSIGIALYPYHANDETRLLQCADVAMYMAKKAQTRIAVYDSGQDLNSVRHLALTGQLRKAIENHELFFAYQPKIDLSSGKVYGAEALARWNHPVHGFIPPDEFITQAEHTGLIEPLTKWCIDTAISQAAEWKRAGTEIVVAINLSPRALHLDELPKMLEESLDRYDVPPRLVTLEITESGIMHDTESALRIIEHFSALGVHLSIDDFGTGYSSLAILKQLPVNELKIDKSFVMQMTENKDDVVIVRSTIDLAHNLGLKVVAEGIESADHVSILTELGCDTGQGFFISKPVPTDDFWAWLKARDAQLTQEESEDRALEPV